MTIRRFEQHWNASQLIAKIISNWAILTRFCIVFYAFFKYRKREIKSQSSSLSSTNAQVKVRKKENW